MELDLHQLDLRYEALRKRSPRQERQLATSLLEQGQQMPIVVVAGDGGRLVLIDGYKRVRALRKLARDRVRATTWAVDEAEALLLERLMRAGSEDALEQGWLVAELHERFSLSCEELARRFDKSKSWVSRRLSLVKEVPETVQAQVRAGEIAAHTAMKYLVPLARANAAEATRLCAAIAPLKLTTRQVALLYGACSPAPTRPGSSSSRPRRSTCAPARRSGSLKRPNPTASSCSTICVRSAASRAPPAAVSSRASRKGCCRESPRSLRASCPRRGP